MVFKHRWSQGQLQLYLCICKACSEVSFSSSFYYQFRVHLFVMLCFFHNQFALPCHLVQGALILGLISEFSGSVSAKKKPKLERTPSLLLLSLSVLLCNSLSFCLCLCLHCIFLVRHVICLYSHKGSVLVLWSHV